MPIQHSPRERQTRSQARPHVVLTSTPAVPQLRAQLDRGPCMEGRKRAKKIKFILRSSWQISRTFKDHFQRSCTGGPTLAQSNQSEPSLLAIMQQMTQIMANLQGALFSEESRPPAFKTPSMKEPECFDGTQPFKVRSFIQSFQLIFHNDLASFSQDRKKVLYSTSFLIGRAAK
ncbi:hypothetical protein O181_028638 [Austropuccinia psidii MF-1]|uniref:Uncharacterized protein n=1 Tax=Austropuccinia psidii MF-1 TaxID=1389203 RepID=A0A9Q3CU73_9BASI|nr:hypothetical protein [Austropuccinia psidii MF-1]